MSVTRQSQPRVTKTIESRLGSLPVPLSERTWNPWLAAAVCATAAIATWSFVTGGLIASYVGARAGTATILAGALIAQFLVTLAQVPPTVRYGLETVATTKPQLGNRGSYVSLFIQYAVLIGWNLVLMIFFGKAVASVLQTANLIAESQRHIVSVTASVIGVALVWLLLTNASRALAYIGPIVAVTVIAIGTWMLVVLFRAYGWSEIAAARPLSPIGGGRLANYTLATEAMMVATLTWWAYMGGILRRVSSAGRAVLPSMVSLGFGWALIALISIYSSLVTGELDPTVWMVELGTPAAGLIVLIFISFANIGSTLVGTHAAVLGIGQIPIILRRIKSWRLKSAITVAPMVAILIFFPNPFYDNIGIFLAFVGILVAPLVGMQIVDWFVFGRISSMHVPSLYRHDYRSHYWYIGGFNISGLIGLLFGGVVYLVMLNPLTYEPQNVLFQYTSATIPSVLAGGVAYWLACRIGNYVSHRPKRLVDS